jgi:hypothetical protein
MGQSFHDNCSFTNDNMCLRLFMSFHLNSKDSFEINVKKYEVALGYQPWPQGCIVGNDANLGNQATYLVC